MPPSSHAVHAQCEEKSLWILYLNLIAAISNSQFHKYMMKIFMKQSLTVSFMPTNFELACLLQVKYRFPEQRVQFICPGAPWYKISQRKLYAVLCWSSDGDDHKHQNMIGNGVAAVNVSNHFSQAFIVDLQNMILLYGMPSVYVKEFKTKIPLNLLELFHQNLSG